MRAVLYQAAAVVLLSVPHFLVATLITWLSYTEELLISHESPLGVPLTKSQVNMVGSFLLLGSMATVLTTWHLPEVIGRKNSELLVGIILTLSWSLIATAHSATQLILARAISGVSIGLHFMVSTVYINEISEPHIRGAMANIPYFFYSFGSVVSFLCGWFCSYRFIVYMNLVMSVVYTVGVNFLMESPVYLLTRRKDKEAMRSLKFYRGTSKATPAVFEEFNYLQKQREAANEQNGAVPEEIKLKEAEGDAEGKGVPDMSPWKILLTSKPTQRALLTVASLAILNMLMGFLALQMYAGPIFSSAAPGLSPHLCSVIMAVAITVGNALAVFITDLVPRRVLSISTSTICALSLLTLCTVLRWNWAPSWAVPASVLAFSCSYTSGVGNIPAVQLSESFMPKVKVLASAIFMAVMFGTNFLMISFFGVAVDLLGLDGIFFIFFLFTVFATVLTFFIMKETKEIPLEDILKMYERGFLFWK